MVQLDHLLDLPNRLEAVLMICFLGLLRNDRGHLLGKESRIDMSMFSREREIHDMRDDRYKMMIKINAYACS